MVVGIVALLWIASIIGIFWVYDDASRRKGGEMGCMWALVVLALGPIGFLGYLLARER